MEPINIKSELDELIARIEAGDRPVLSVERREAMKQRLMAKVRITPHVRVDVSVFSLIGAIRLLAEKVRMSLVQRVEVKENLMLKIEEMPQRRFFLSSYFSLMRKTVSAVLLLVLAFGMFSYMTATTNIVQAGTFTMLDSFSGTVSVKRGSATVKLKTGMPLMENDALVTGVDGLVVIRYFDNSVSRLDHNTELKINKLSKASDSPVDTHVEISLIAGKIWSRVLNLVESNASFVVKAKNVSTEAKKAAFVVDLNGGKVEVGVFNHAVSIKTDGKTKQVLTGEKMVVDKGSSDIKHLDKKEKSTDWVKDNLKNDQVYLSQVEQRLLDAKKKVLGSDNSLNVALLLTFDDVNKKKLELDIAERGFIKAQVKLSDKNITDAEKAEAQATMQVFGDKIKDFYGLIDEIARTDQVYAKELKAYVDAKVLLQKKDLAVAVPDTPGYQAKKILDDAQLVGANNDADKVKLKVDQAADKLAVAEDVKASGNLALATKVVDEYKQDMNGVVKMVDNLSTAQSDLKDQVSLKVADNNDLLKAIDVVPQRKVDEVQKVVEPVQVEAKEKTVDKVDPAKVVDGPYGVQLRDGKPLPPLLQDVQ
ncbi:FecR domain-containing protein [Candidatus Peregrinibacteria bacterium]|nr:FecR domain-containing protein [Candidatus Peregrinibacteria bacterium]